MGLGESLVHCLKEDVADAEGITWLQRQGLRQWDQTPMDSWSYLKVDEAKKDPQPQPLKEANASALNLSLPQHPDRQGTLTKGTGKKAQP